MFAEEKPYQEIVFYDILFLVVKYMGYMLKKLGSSFYLSIGLPEQGSEKQRGLKVHRVYTPCS